MKNDSSSPARRNDLDALRAFAMILGIALHASLAFFPSYWMVLDDRQSPWFGVFFSAIHGFRMPLFFVMCGFFSAMLLHSRGRWALVKHRYKRVLLPLLAGLVTVIPATMWVSGVAMASKSGGRESKPPEASIWTAAAAGDVAAVERHLAEGIKVDQREPASKGTALQWAAASGKEKVIELLAKKGADVNAPTGDGGTALHGSAFLGYVKATETLIQLGANVNAANARGDTPLTLAELDEGTTRYFARALGLTVSDDLAKDKAAIAEMLRAKGAIKGTSGAGVLEGLMQFPLFSHLWFLWFLWWLVVGYAILSAIGSLLPAVHLPDRLVLSPVRYLWLVPLTMVFQMFMGGGESPIFGPDTSTGLIPVPHILAYYAVFFGFGVLYYGRDARADHIGEHWGIPLALGLLGVLPLGLALMGGWDGLGLEPSASRWLIVGLQALYPWLLTFGLMGLFRKICSSENARIRYVSDSAYWLYLIHLPLIIGAQILVRHWPLPAVVKFAGMTAVVTAFLLWTYQIMVRYTWIGRFLNGPRTRDSV